MPKNNFNETIKEADKLLDEINKNSVEKIEKLYTSLTNTTSKLKDSDAQSAPKLHSREDALLLLAEMTKDLSDAKFKLTELYNRVDSRDLKVYLDKKYLMQGYTAEERNRLLEAKYRIGKRQIQKICQKIEKKFKSSR